VSFKSAMVGADPQVRHHHPIPFARISIRAPGPASLSP
jgi:hypothetical protein